MLVEIAERLGPSLAWWLDAPFALALWSYKQLEEIDRRHRWLARVQRLEAAELMSLAVNEPKRLQDERTRILASAASRLSAPVDALKAHGERMARFVRKGQVLVS